MCVWVCVWCAVPVGAARGAGVRVCGVPGGCPRRCGVWRGAWVCPGSGLVCCARGGARGRRWGPGTASAPRGGSPGPPGRRDRAHWAGLVRCGRLRGAGPVGPGVSPQIPQGFWALLLLRAMKQDELPCMQQAPGGCAHLARTRRRPRWRGVVWRGCGMLRHMPGSGAGGMNSRTTQAICSHMRHWRDIPACPHSAYGRPNPLEPRPVHASPHPGSRPHAWTRAPGWGFVVAGGCRGLGAFRVRWGGGGVVGSMVPPRGGVPVRRGSGTGVGGVYSGVHRSAVRGRVIHGFVLWRDCGAAGGARGAEVPVPGGRSRREAWSRAYSPVPVPGKPQCATRDSGLTPPA
jgi:hypothetical protein